MADHPAPTPVGDQFGAVEGADGISVVRGGGITRGWNGIQYRAGLWEHIIPFTRPAASGEVA